MRTGLFESGTRPAPLRRSERSQWRSEIATPASLQIGLLNLMPNKPVTDRQFATLLARCGRPVNLLRTLPEGHCPHTTPAEYLAIHYAPWHEVEERPLDGLIVTGAPIEHLEFEAVSYWPELTRIFDWTRREGIALMSVCWAAEAALYHFHRIEKQVHAEKLFGVYAQTVRAADSDLLAGFGAAFPTPVSRYATIEREALDRIPGLQVLADSSVGGVSLVDEPGQAASYMLNHLEYEADTIATEYRRDLAAGKPTRMPVNYFPRGNLALAPAATWAPYGQKLFANWLDRLLARRALRHGRRRR
ncbi:MAG: homoserine O-succinyltransferase [Azospirillaceae bacterium]